MWITNRFYFILQLIYQLLLFGDLVRGLFPFSKQCIVGFFEFGVVSEDAVDLSIVGLDDSRDLSLLFFCQFLQTLYLLGVVIFGGTFGLMNQNFEFLLQLFFVCFQSFNFLFVLDYQTLDDLVLFNVDSNEITSCYVLMHFLLLLLRFLVQLLVFEFSALREQFAVVGCQLGYFNFELLQMGLFGIYNQFGVCLLQPNKGGFEFLIFFFQLMFLFLFSVNNNQILLVGLTQRLCFLSETVIFLIMCLSLQVDGFLVMFKFLSYFFVHGTTSLELFLELFAVVIQLTIVVLKLHVFVLQNSIFVDQFTVLLSQTFNLNSDVFVILLVFG